MRFSQFNINKERKIIMKRILALALALLLVFGATGCKSSNQTSSDNVSYITTYEDEYIDVYDEDGNPVSSTTQSGTSNQSGGGKENSGTSSSGGNAGTPSTKPVNKTGTISNLDFGGKTFTKTIIGTAPAYKIRMKEAFEKSEGPAFALWVITVFRWRWPWCPASHRQSSQWATNSTRPKIARSAKHRGIVPI